MGGPPGSSSGSGRPGAKPGGVAVALKLPCATLDEVKARHPELKARSFFVRTSQPLAMDTVIRLKTQLSDGTPCFRAAAVVERVQSAGGPPGSMPGMTLSLMRMDDAGRELVAWMGGKPPALLVEAPPPAAKPAVPSGGPAAKPAVPSSGPASKPPPAAPKSPAAPAKPPPAAKPSPTAASGPPAARPSPATPKASPPSKPPSAPPAAPPPAAPQGPLDDLPPPDDWDAPPAAAAPAPAPATPPPASPAPPPPSAARAPEPATSPAASPAADGGDPWALPSEAGGWAAQAAGSPPAGAASSQADELEMSWDPEADAGDAAAQPATGTPEAWLEAPAEAKPPPPPTPPAPRAPPVPASPASPAAAAPTPAAAAPTPAAAAPTPAAAAPTPAAAAPTPAAAAPPPAPPSAAPAWPPPAEAAAAPPAAPAPAATPKAPPAPAGPARAASPAPAPAPASPSASAPPGAAARPAGPLPAAAKGAPAPASPPKAPPAPVPSARPPGSRPGDLPPPQQSHQSRRPEAPLPRPTLAPGTKAEPAPAADYPEHLEAAVPAKRDGPAKGPIIGIDLGTTNSCAAVVRDGKPFIIPSREGYNTIPSVVAVSDKGKLMVGHPAKGQLLINPRSTVYGAKRLIGRQFNSPVVSEMVGRFSYEIVAGQRGEAAVKLGGQVFSLQKISSLVLAEVKDLAQQWLGSEVSRAVITVPAYYNDNQRQAVRAAGALAGLEVERILNEPTAAAIAFAHGRKLEQRVMVYDLGGGTFDTSVLQLRGNVYEVISTGGDTFLGGVDFDKALVGELLARFKQKHGMEFPGDRVAYQRVVDAAERAKIALSERLTTQANVPFVALINDKAYDLDTTVSRAELEKLTAGLIDRSLSVCDQVLTSCGLKPSDIGDVLIVGGQSRMPLVRAKLREFFGKEPSKAVHPDEAVALGAAVLAQSIQSDEIGGMVLVDVLPMSIGIGLPGGRFKKVVERNTSLPYKKTHSIWTSQDNQKTLEIPVFQGENLRARDNEYLGTLVVPDLPPGTRGNVVFDIVFSISAESILTVSAEERGTARSVSATFSTQDTPEAVKRRLSGAAAGADEPQAAPAAAAKEAKGGWMKRIFGGS